MALILGAVALAMAGTGSSPSATPVIDAARKPAPQQAESSRGRSTALGSVRPERHRGSVRPSGSASNTRKLLSQRPTVDLGDRFGWRPDTTTIIADTAGRPWVNLEDGRDLEPVFAGAEEVLEKLDRELGEPLGLASADFDEDGIPDLITTYAAASNGFVTIHFGNPDSIYPNAPDARQRKSAGTFTDEPFLTPGLVYPAPVAAVWLGTGDFDADGHKDLVLAARDGATLYHLPGDGDGGFGGAREIPLPGRITAMTFGEINRRDGLEDVVVAVNSERGPEVLVFEWPTGALRGEPEVFEAPDEVTDLALAELDGEYPIDLAVAAGYDLVLVRGRDRRLSLDAERRANVPSPAVDRRLFPFRIAELEAGRFAGDVRKDLALLGEDGRVYLLERESGRPLDAWKQASSSEPIIEVSKTAARSYPAQRLVRARLSSLPEDDLVVVDRAVSRLLVMTAESLVAGKTGSSPRVPSPVSIEVDGQPVAVLPMRLNRDALHDLVVLKGSGAPIGVVETKAARSFVVNDSGNEDDANLSDDCKCKTDSGACTLRAAVHQSSMSSCGDGVTTITFSVNTARIETNTLLAMNTVTIDGTGMGMVKVIGNAAQITLRSGDSTVRGLDIGELRIQALPNVLNVNSVIEGNHIGVNLDDGADFGGGLQVSEPEHLIGGRSAAARNVFAGKHASVDLNDDEASDIRIEGNYIGTDPSAGTGLGGGYGVRITAQATNNTIGGAASGAGNVISGNDSAGVEISYGGAANLVQGNYIGTDASGGSSLANGQEGVRISRENTVANTLGGTTAKAGNVISGNSQDGARIDIEATENLVQGNFIGTDAGGSSDLGNSFDGVIVWSSDNTVGGVVVGAGNVVSGNEYNGIEISGEPTGVRVQGNLIGTDSAGSAAIANGVSGSSSRGSGVFVSTSADNLIGGTEPGAGNLISGNVNHGVETRHAAARIGIHGNFIGTGAGGTGELPNGGHGVNGGGNGPIKVGTEAPNTIAYNGRAGVHASAKGVEIRTNSIFDNQQLGINIGSDGVQNNDTGDTDGGGNNGQNYPVLSSEGGTLNSTPNTTFTIDLYTNTECDPSGHGEGEMWVTSLSATTDGDGNASFPITAFGIVTATATDSDGNTSEFSACLDAGEPKRGLRIDAPARAFTADQVEITVTVLAENGSVDTAYGGEVTVRLGFGTTPGLAELMDRDTGATGQALTVRPLRGVVYLTLHAPDASFNGQTVITPETVLDGTAVIEASLPDGEATERSVRLDSPLDLRIDRIEVQQGARTDDPNRMIRDRMVMVRIFVAANTDQFQRFGSIEGVSAWLAVTDDSGQPIPGSPFQVRYGKGPASSRPRKEFVLTRVPTDEQRFLGEDALNYDLPAKLVDRRRLKFDAELINPYPDKLSSNDSRGLGPLTFESSRPVTLLWARARYSKGGVESQFPDKAKISRNFDVLYLTYPLSDPKLRFVKLPDQVLDHNPLPTSLASQLAFWMNLPEEAHAVAMLYMGDDDFLAALYPPDPLDPQDRPPLGVTNRLGGTVMLVNADLCSRPEFDCTTLPHELGHVFGLGDTYADGGEAPGVNPRKPDATANGNPVEDGTFDWANAWYVSRRRVFEADYMGNNGENSTTDQVNWNHHKASFFKRSGATKVNESASLLVRGFTRRGGGAQLGTCYTLDGLALSESVANGSHVVEIVDSGGSVLDTLGFEPDYRVTDTDEELDEYRFGFVLPFSDGIKKVRIKAGGNILDSIDVSANNPSVEFSSTPSGTVSGPLTVSWQGSDPDGDSLTHSLFYSPDGELKVPLVEETTATTFSWDSGEYLSGDAPRLVLVVSDGVRSTLVESGVFDMPDREPEVYISEPADGARFKRTDPVPLAATVFDPEDGLVTGDAEIGWTSSRDGALGSGESLAAEGLSLGSHTITASFTDPAGNTGSDSVTIEVTNGPVCVLTCSPSAPGTATVGEQLSFDAGVTAKDCTHPIEYIWDFGDGSAGSSSEDPSHRYLEEGFYSWQMIAASGTTYCSEVGGVAASGGMHYSYLIPASAHAAGAEGTSWVTDVVLHDPGAITALGGLHFHDKDRDNSSSSAEAVLVGTGYSLGLDDVVEDTFGEGSTSGAIRVSSTEPLIVSSRTYNDAAGGTFGQYVPGMPESEAIEAGDEVRLIQLTRTDDFRTNIGFASLSATPINVVVDLYRADGTNIRAKSYSVDAFGYSQVNDIIGKLASGDVEEAYALVRSNTAGARYFTYASVVDNRSGDPVLILPVSSSEADSGPCGLDGWESLDPGGDFADFSFGGGFSNGSRHFLLGSPGVIISSTDGESWSTVPSGTAAYLTGGAWNGSRFAIVGRDGVILTSNNGTSWTTRSSGTSKILSDVAWGAGKFVAVGDDGTILTSPDGVSWTGRTSGTTQDLWGVAWNGSTFVVVGRSSALGGGTVLSSTNGISWTSRTAAAGSGWPYHVAWGNGRFVSVGLNGDIATSSNGATWTARSSGITYDLLGIIWDGSQFVAAGDYGTVLSSPDGVVWTYHDARTLNRLQTLVWTGGRHVAAGLGGTALRTRACSAGEPLWITAGAHAEGVGGTNWVTDLEIHNPDDTRATVTISLLPKGTNNTSHETEELTVEPGSSRRIADVLYSLFDFTGAAALRVEARGAAVMVGSRTYNNAPTGTFGQFVPGVPESESVSGGSVRLVQLSRSASLTSGFRTNIGFTNMDATAISMTVELYDGSGTLLGTTQHNVKPYGQNQITDIFGRVTSGDVANGYAVVSSSTPGARFMTYASVVDNRSGDPIYIPAN